MGIDVNSAVTYHACEILQVGPEFGAEERAKVNLYGGWEVSLAPGFFIDHGATLNVQTCGQSLCMASPDPMPYGCHPCVNLICDNDPLCCTSTYDRACVDKVNSTCGLNCE